MALFAPFLPVFGQDQSIFDVFDDHPLVNFRSSGFRDALNATRTYNRANVIETDTEYKVEIEVPGYQKSEISLEYGHDGRTLVVSGRTEKSFEEVEGETPQTVTVEDVPEEGSQEKSASKPAEESAAVAATSKDKTVGAPAEPKYWISERSVGSFRRSFSLPSRLELGKAKASLDHGVLNVVIPKATEHIVQKITIA